MAATIGITCPHCKKQLRGPEELVGKKVRCKACSHIFTVQAPAAAKEAPPVPKAAPARGKPQPEKPPARAKAPLPPLEGADQLPYQLTDVLKLLRCPQCAAEMEEGDIICLNCGYNTQTRVRMPTVKTWETTASERLAWLSPALACVLVALLAIGAVVLLWVYPLQYKPEERPWYFHKSLQIYGTFIGLWLAWHAGKFAFRRLILHPEPPEKIKG